VDRYDARQRRGRRGGIQVVGELRLGPMRARRRIEEVVHLAVVVVLPGRHVAGHHLALGASRRRCRDDAGGERGDRDPAERNGAREQSPATAVDAPRTRDRRPALEL
jgi:hypothetical protein